MCNVDNAHYVYTFSVHNAHAVHTFSVRVHFKFFV